LAAERVDVRGERLEPRERGVKAHDPEQKGCVVPEFDPAQALLETFALPPENSATTWSRRRSGWQR
jgi:hypothetical protein